MKWRKDNKNTNFSNWKDTASKEYKEILKIRFRLIKRNRGRKSSIRYKINGIIFTIKSKMWISTCKNMTEFVRKYPRTKSDLRIFKISHSTEVYISEIRERIGLSKIQCLKLQTLKTNIRYMRIIYIYDRYESCLYRWFDKHDRRTKSNPISYMEIIDIHFNNTFYGSMIGDSCDGSFENYTSDKKSDRKFWINKFNAFDLFLWPH